jgi:hypothetical protein
MSICPSIMQRAKLTGSQVITFQNVSKGSWGSSARRYTESNGDIIYALDIIFCLDDSVESISWADCGRNCDTDDSGAGDREEGSECGCGGGEKHFDFARRLTVVYGDFDEKVGLNVEVDDESDD